MPTDRDARRGASVLRVLGIIVALALGTVAAWLIVTGKTQKRIEIGVLIGLWGGLIAAYSMFTRQRVPADLASAVREQLDQQRGQELDRQATGQVERAEDAARRDHEARLEEMLTRQIQAALSVEVASLRSEVASLRSELVEKVGGQIQLERIEITRVIGSDIEALQQEVRQLKTARVSAASATTQVFAADPPAVASFTRPAAELRPAAEARPAVGVRPANPVVAAPPAPVSAPAASPIGSAEPATATIPATVAPAAASAAPARAGGDDPFAALPRLSRFDDPGAEPTATMANANGHAANGHTVNGSAVNGSAANGHAVNGHAVNGLAVDGRDTRDQRGEPTLAQPVRPVQPVQAGRRRSPDDDLAGRTAAGRHSVNHGVNHGVSPDAGNGVNDAAGDGPAGGRRRRESAAEDDVLARVLGRANPPT